VAADSVLRDALASLVKLALNARLFALLFTVLWLPAVEPGRQVAVVWLLAVVGVTSLTPLLLWERLAPWLLGHPSALLVDLLVAGGVLALVGLDSPFGLFVLTTALIAGILYDHTGAVVMTIALLAMYFAGAVLSESVPSAAELLATPVLLPVAAAGGVGVRRLLTRQHDASTALAEQALNTAAGAERARLAREMHDTLAKTLHGISLSATAIPRLLEHDRGQAVVAAEQLAANAGQAAVEARSLLVDLRSDELDRPLGDVVRDSVQAWARRTGTRNTVTAAPCAGLSPSERYELFCILREALRNAHVHGGAPAVEVALHDEPDGTVELTIIDHGRGFTPPPDLASLTDGDHFGVVGMAERAAAIGGDFTLDSRPGGPTRVAVRLPAAVDEPPSEPSRPEATADMRSLR
jgi:signal transduction histidine kinase